LSSRLLSENGKIKMYATVMLCVVVCGCKIWSLTLRKEHRLRVFEKRLLRRIFGLKMDEMIKVEENCMMRSSQLVLFAKYN
jgi:hypothetical protein